MKMTRNYYLSALIGLIFGLLTIYIVPNNLELVVWLVLVIFIGALSARIFTTKLFRNTFQFALLVGISITLTHISLLANYLETHKEEVEMINQFQILDSDRLTLLAIAPLYWIILGLFSGLVALGFRKLRKNIS